MTDTKDIYIDTPAPVAVKPGEIERIVWQAMDWASRNPFPGSRAPAYTDNGNSLAEDKARATARCILSTLTPSPRTYEQGWAEAIEAAAKVVMDYAKMQYESNKEVHPAYAKDVLEDGEDISEDIRTLTPASTED